MSDGGGKVHRPSPATAMLSKAKAGRAPGGNTKRNDAKWCARAWEIFKHNPHVEDLQAALGCQRRTAAALVQKGGAGTLPFADRIKAIAEARASEVKEKDLHVMDDIFRGLASAARTNVILAQAMEEEAEKLRARGAKPAELNAAVPPREVHTVTVSLARGLEVLTAAGIVAQVQREGRLSELVDHASSAQQALGGVIGAIARVMGMRGHAAALETQEGANAGGCGGVLIEIGEGEGE